MAAGIDKVREIAERVAQSSGLEVVDLELLGGGKARMLRVFIDKPGGVTHEDCCELQPRGGHDLRRGRCGTGQPVHAGSFVAGAGSQAVEAGRLSALYRQPGEVDDPRSGERKPAFRRPAEGVSGWPAQLELTRRKKSKKHRQWKPGTEVEIALGNVEKANLVPEF